MIRKAAVVVLLAAASCASSQDADVAVAPVAAATADPRTAELQVALTELLEQVDVLNARIARLEAAADSPARPAPAQAAAASVAPVEVAEPVAAAEPSRSESPAPAPVEPRPSSSLAAAALAQAYRDAVVLFGKNRFAEARGAFQKVFDSEPAGELADNALFWIGETWFAEKNWTQAMTFYRRVTTEYAQENKAPDAMFKIAMAYERTGDLALARETLRELIRLYPYSSSSASAKRELERIRY